MTSIHADSPVLLQLAHLELKEFTLPSEDLAAEVADVCMYYTISLFLFSMSETPVRL